MAKQKYYTIWKWRKTGVFDSWEQCKPLVEKFVGAQYKSFRTKQEAQSAFLSDYFSHISPKKTRPTNTSIQQYIVPSISVDGAWNTINGQCEYQWVDTASKRLLFQQGPFDDGTNNIVEFLAIVHALAYCHKNNSTMPIYSDSRTAIAWVKKQKANTKQTRTSSNQELFILIEKAEKWLKNHQYNNQILKWDTVSWGEIPADFGRK